MVQAGTDRRYSATTINAAKRNITMFKMYQRTISLLLIVLIAVSCNYQERNFQESSAPKPEIDANALPGPETLVKAYCDFDAKGKRFFRSLSDKELSYYRGLVHWDEEPRWDTVVMISNYNIGKTKTSENAAEITVTYQVKGKYSQAVTDIYEKVEKIKYWLVKTETGWKIEGPVTPPHVYPRKLIAILEKRSNYERDAAKKVKFQNDANLIKNLKYFSFKEKGPLL
jgi:hypothetical protein